MAIIRSGEEARKILARVTEEGKALPCFCTESVYTTEAVFLGAKQFRESSGIRGKLPLIIAFTASYHDRQQLKNYTGLADFKEGILAVKNDIERLAREDGPFHDLDVIVHLDHAQPGQDDWIIDKYHDFISSVMWDCSAYSIRDNIRIMKDFVARNHSWFIIEGAVDEVYNYSAENQKMEMVDNITDPDTALHFLEETGVDLIVANVGTEHRRTEGTVQYHRKEALDISGKTGRKLVLHGTSSLREEELESIAEDGFVKINLWGKLESDPGKKLAINTIRELNNILSKKQTEELVNMGFISKAMMEKEYHPSIHFLTEKYRRDEIYLPETTGIVKRFYKILYS